MKLKREAEIRPESGLTRLPRLAERGKFAAKGGAVRRGAWRVITNPAVMGFDKTARRMYLNQFFPEASAEKVQARTGSAVDVSRSAPIDPPSAEELRILREVCGPEQRIPGESNLR